MLSCWEREEKKKWPKKISFYWVEGESVDEQMSWKEEIPDIHFVFKE